MITFDPYSIRFYFIDAGYCDEDGTSYDDGLDDEFKDADHCSCSLLSFDSTFPLPFHSKEERDKMTFYVLQYCYQNGRLSRHVHEQYHVH